MKQKAEDNELRLLRVVRRQLEVEGWDLGEYAYEPPPSNVDFVLDDAIPHRLAIEMTSIRNPDEEEGPDAAMKHLEDGLANRVEGGWVLDVELRANMKELRPAIADLIGEDIEIRPGSYTTQDLEAAGGNEGLQEFLDRDRRLSKLGLVEIRRRSAPPELEPAHGVDVYLMRRAGPIQGFGKWLDNAVHDNSTKLARAREEGYETHLVVEVIRSDASAYWQCTPVPEVPKAIDRLWVWNPWALRRGQPDLWWAIRGSSEWQTRRTEPEHSRPL